MSNNRIKRIPNDVQDKHSEAWLKLCAYIDELAESGGEEFAPYEVLGPDMFAQIYTLPQSIAKLKKVKKVWLYGSQLKRIPPEIGEMESLVYFDPYTSYDLMWFPYEITKCKNLRDSRISTRALYGNFKNRKPFPKLDHNPVRYEGEKVKCSVCDKECEYDKIEQYWISLGIGTDVVPLLANLCSENCKNELPEPPENYIPHPHKGGADLKQSPTYWDLVRRQAAETPKEKPVKQEGELKPTEISQEKPRKVLKFIRKIWDKE